MGHSLLHYDEMPMKILIVEDSKSDELLLIQRLKSTSTKFISTAVRSLNEAREKLQTGKFDIVFLDLQLDDSRHIEDSLEFLVAHPDQRIVIITATDDSQVMLECFRMGAFEYITKPLLKSEFLGRVLNYAKVTRLSAEPAC